MSYKGLHIYRPGYTDFSALRRMSTISALVYSFTKYCAFILVNSAHEKTFPTEPR